MTEEKQRTCSMLEDDDFRERLASLERACEKLSGHTDYLTDKMDFLNMKFYDKYEKDTEEEVKNILAPVRHRHSRLHNLTEKMAEQRKSMELLQTEMNDKTQSFTNNLQEVDSLQKQINNEQERIQNLDKILRDKLETMNNSKT